MAHAADWPQWLGPNRGSVWREEGIVAELPDELLIKWRVPVELGYAGPAVAGGRVFVCDYVRKTGDITNTPGGRDQLEGSERILCFDARTGKQLWKQTYNRPYKMSYAGGPRCTPTVDGERVYTLGAEGDLLCLNTSTGAILWKKNFLEDYDAATPYWGNSAHPLVDEKNIYCLVGGEGSVTVAFDKLTGTEVWRALSAKEPGYCPPTMIEHKGIRQLVIWHPESINGLNPENGKLLWSVPLVPNYGMSVTAPRQLNDTLYASGLGHVGVLLDLNKLGKIAKLSGTSAPKNSAPKNTDGSAAILWRGKAKQSVYCCNSTPFLQDDMIYGCDSTSGALIGARLSDGERLWETFLPTTGQQRASHGTAFIIRHGNRFFLFSEQGDLILARLTKEG
ncbi:MAG: PQQ-binding-like beta-propeller repeat protein, partial [Verrucomicrobia bacterium]|nr:PQQ-binding-like beta-propeller repeat protein [Verrucomicrobiota bacterium]